MSIDDERGNPFPAAAVARLTEHYEDVVTIPTPAIRQAVGYVDDYLATGHRSGGRESEAAFGNVVAVVGEYGTGKTHIALEILRHISQTGTPVQRMYLDAPADTFLALYRERFIDKVTKSELRDLVQMYYADLVADSLAESDLTSEAARRLREREVGADAVIDRLGLMESAFLQDLQERLLIITENESFAAALTLFLRPEFEDAVWEWLRGYMPDPALVERGIGEAIDSDTAALEAIGVVAFLYGRQSHRFVLVIDELEKVLAPPQRPGIDSVLAFKKLLEIFSGAQAFLVLSGLPDFMEALPEDVQQRIGCIVRPSALGSEEIRTYIQDVQEQVGGVRTLAPFTPATVGYLVKLAGGNARTIIKLCYHSYHAARAAGTNVTEAMIREAARSQFQIATRDDVRAEIARVLDLGGWLFQTEHVLDNKSRLRVDFWVPHGDEGGGCAILVTDSVLSKKEATTIADQAKAIKGSDPGRAVLIVVNGYLSESLTPTLVSVGDREPLTHSERRFTADLDAALKGIMQRLETTGRENDIKALQDRVERLTRQQSQLLSSVSRFSDSLEELGHIRSSLAVQASSLTHLEQSVHDAMQAVVSRGDEALPEPVNFRDSTFNGDVHLHFPETTSTTTAASRSIVDNDRSGQLPEPVAREFTTALRVLDEYVSLDSVIARPLALAAGLPPSTRWTDRLNILKDSQEALLTVGALAILKSTIERFRDSVADWLLNQGRDVEPDSGADGRPPLTILCRAYDDTFESLPRRVQMELDRPSPSHGDPDFRLKALGRRVHRAAADMRNPR